MPAVARFLLTSLVVIGLAAPADAAPVTLSDGATEVVIDPTSPDGMSVWRIGGVDHVKKIWYWASSTTLGGDFDGSIDQANVVAQFVTDTNGDGADDTLVVDYVLPDGTYGLHFAWRLQDNGVLSAGPPVSRHSSLTTQISVRKLPSPPGTGDLDLIRYVDLDLGGTPEDELLLIGPATRSNQALWNLTVQENVAGAYPWELGFARYRSATTLRPPDYTAVPVIGDTDIAAVDISDYPIMETNLNTPGFIFWSGANGATEGDTGDLTWSYGNHIDVIEGDSQAWSFVETLETGAAVVSVPSLPGLIELFNGLVGQQLIFGTGGPNLAPVRLGLFSFVLNLAAGFSEAGFDAAKCILLNVADRRSDGDQQVPDWVDGNGLPELQQEIKDVGTAEGCNGGEPPTPTDNPNQP
jgi:hypothetical protein